MTTAAPGVRLLYLVFFVSGAPALVYQVVWQRVLTLYFGVDIYSTSVTVATFMLGLGLGSVVGGQLADRWRSPLRLYLVCELALGLYGLASLELFDVVGRALTGSAVGGIIAADFMLMLVPTTLMGMTLPLMCRSVETVDTAIGRHFSALYALNTLGAASGALLTAYLLIGLLGLDGATYLAAAGNLALAAVVAAVVRRPGAQRTVAPAGRGTDHERPPGYRRIVTCSFLSGFVALGYELAGYRILSCLLHGTSYVFGTILCGLLCGIGLGSWHARRHADEALPLVRFAGAQLALALYLVVLFTLIGRFSWLPGLRHLVGATSLISLHPAPELISGSITLPYLYSLLDILWWTGLVFALPALFMGYGFPQLVRAAAPRVGRLGRAVGGLYLANILGATGGSLATGFLALHWLGTEWTLRLLFLGACLTAALALAAGDEATLLGRRLRRRQLLAGLVLLAAVGAPLLPARYELLAALHYADFPQVGFVAGEDRSGVVALRRQDAVVTFAVESELVGVERLLIDGAAHGQLEPGAAEAARDWGVEMALAAHSAPAEGLSIGLGDGKMVAAALATPEVRRLVVVELNGVLAEVLAATPQGRAVSASPKLELIVDDGRRWLLANPEARFDFVLLWPLHAAHAYSGNLFSREFFELVAAHLRPGGVLYARTADAYSTARTLAVTFPDLLRFGGTRYVAGVAPLRFDAARLPLPAPAALTVIEADRRLILERTVGAPLNRDLRPRAEYYLTYPWAPVLRTREPVAVYREPDPERFADRLATSLARGEP